MLSLILATALALLTIVPPDALRYELLRSLRAQPHRLGPVLLWRLTATLPLAFGIAGLVQLWASAGPAGPLMVVFSGVLTATWLWMRFWIRTFIAAADHPPLDSRAATVLLSTLLSATLWIALFTQAALLLAWVETPALLFSGVLIWPLVDALLLLWGRHSDRAGRWLVQESAQQRLGRVLGTLLLALSIGAIWAVLAQG